MKYTFLIQDFNTQETRDFSLELPEGLSATGLYAFLNGYVFQKYGLSPKEWALIESNPALTVEAK